VYQAEAEKKRSDSGESLPVLQSNKLRGFDGFDGADVNASAAVGAGISVDHADFAHFGDGAQRAGVVTGTTVDAIVSNDMGQGIHLLFFGIVSSWTLSSMADTTTPFYILSTRNGGPIWPKVP
jgi:hypothetical protein